MDRTADFSDLKGLILSRIDVQKGDKTDDDYVIFTAQSGVKYKMFHRFHCCEFVYIEDICGDISDLLGTEILAAEERTEEGDQKYRTQTWTFYILSTIKGTVTIRWNGESNGYYSVWVDFEREK